MHQDLGEATSCWPIFSLTVKVAYRPTFEGVVIFKTRQER